MERYPEFLPWCLAVRIKSREGNKLVAEVVIRESGEVRAAARMAGEESSRGWLKVSETDPVIGG